MKKIILILSICFALSLCMGLISCGSGNSGSADNSASETSSESVKPSQSESSAGSESESGSDSSSELKPQEEVFEITSPKGVVYPYSLSIKAYLEAGVGANVNLYDRTRDYEEPVVIEWDCTLENVEGFKVELSTSEDFSDATIAETSAYQMKLNVYNLYKNAGYYLRVTAKIQGGSEKSVVSTFKTTESGARIMHVQGITNVRDLGGYVTESGKTTAQGIIYRGGALSKSTDTAYDTIALTENGKKVMSETMKIKTDFDLRSVGENLGLIESPIPNANLEYYNVGGYLSAFTSPAPFAAVFKALSDSSRYPVYMHCTGGADRTGTVAFLLNALVGVSETDLIHDYELTSFTVYGERNSQGTIYDFAKFLAQLKTYEGETLSEKTENYMLSIGLNETEIYNLKAIMFGEPLKIAIGAPSYYNITDETDFVLNLSEKCDVSSVKMGGEEVKFTVADNKITIAAADIPKSLAKGKVKLSLVINAVEYELSFEYDTEKKTYLLPFVDGKVTLAAGKVKAQGDLVVGYDGTIAEIHVDKITDDGAGGTYFMIGSYGVYLRGGGFRITEKHGDTYNSYHDLLAADGYRGVMNGGAKFGLSVKDNGDNTVTISVYVNGEFKGSQTINKVTDEIDSENATFSVEINAASVTEAIISIS